MCVCVCVSENPCELHFRFSLSVFPIFSLWLCADVPAMEDELIALIVRKEITMYICFVLPLVDAVGGAPLSLTVVSDGRHQRVCFSLTFFFLASPPFSRTSVVSNAPQPWCRSLAFVLCFSDSTHHLVSSQANLSLGLISKNMICFCELHAVVPIPSHIFLSLPSHFSTTTHKHKRLKIKFFPLFSFILLVSVCFVDLLSFLVFKTLPSLFFCLSYPLRCRCRANFLYSLALTLTRRCVCVS